MFMKYALTYLAGAVTVSGFVLATGGNTATAFWLGFGLAVVLSVLVIYGFRQRIAQKPKLTAVKKSQPVKKHTPVSDPVIAEVVSALVNFGAVRAIAQGKVTTAYRPGMDFDTLFRTASQSLQGSQRHAA